jgi:probable addiction module antidote protein
MNEYLQDRDEVSGFLEAALEEYENDGDIKALMSAIQRVAEAQGGMTELARKTNLNRQNLYRIFSNEVSPRVNTLLKILRALGYTITIKSLAKAS